MAEHLGRSNVLKIDGTTAFCFRTLSEDWSNELIDISSSCSNGFKTTLDSPGERMISMSVEGIVVDQTLRAKIASGNVKFPSAIIEYWDGSTLEAEFALSGISMGSPYKEAATFSATLETSGAYTYTAAP